MANCASGASAGPGALAISQSRSRASASRSRCPLPKPGEAAWPESIFRKAVSEMILMFAPAAFSSSPLSCFDPFLPAP